MKVVDWLVVRLESVPCTVAIKLQFNNCGMNCGNVEELSAIIEAPTRFGYFVLAFESLCLLLKGCLRQPVRNALSWASWAHWAWALFSYSSIDLPVWLH